MHLSLCGSTICISQCMIQFLWICENKDEDIKKSSVRYVKASDIYLYSNESTIEHRRCKCQIAAMMDNELHFTCRFRTLPIYKRLQDKVLRFSLSLSVMRLWMKGPYQTSFLLLLLLTSHSILFNLQERLLAPLPYQHLPSTI